MADGKGLFITFEGMDGSGKTKQVDLLREYLAQQGTTTWSCREPGHTPHGEALRCVIKHPELAFRALNIGLAGHQDFHNIDIHDAQDYEPEAMAELLMFLAARVQFIAKVVKPRLLNGCHVISDRFADSTRAYQGGGSFHSAPEMISLINLLNRQICRDYMPNLTFLLDISIDTMIKRKSADHPDKKDSFEKKHGRDFFERVRLEYHKIAAENAVRFCVINGELPIEEVFAQIINNVQELLPIKTTATTATAQEV